MTLWRNLGVAVIGDTKSLERSLERAGRRSDAFGGKLKSLAKGAGIAAGAAGVAGLVAGLKGSIDAAKEAEVSQAKLRAQLDALGLSYGKHIGAIERTLEEHARLSAFDDEDLADSFTRIVRVTGDVTEALKLNALAADIARARNMDLQTAAELVGKVAGGNLGILSRYGIVLEEGATATEALGTLQRKFAGQAKAYGETAAGAQDRLAVAFENLQERIGQRLLPVIVKLMEALLRFIQFTEREWPKWERTIRNGVESARRVFEDIRPVLTALVQQIENVVRLVAAIFRGDWDEAWKQFRATIVGGLVLARELLQEWVEKIRAIGTRLGEALKNGIAAGLRGLGDLLVAIVRGAINAVIDVWNRLKIPGFTIDPPGPGKISWGGFDFPDIPHLAKGGITTGDGLAFLHKNEAVIPLSSPQARGAIAGVTNHFHFPNYVGDKRELERAMRDAAATYFRRNAQPIGAF